MSQSINPSRPFQDDLAFVKAVTIELLRLSHDELAKRAQTTTNKQGEPLGYSFVLAATTNVIVRTAERVWEDDRKYQAEKQREGATSSGGNGTWGGA
jgi:hypothetical protein